MLWIVRLPLVLFIFSGLGLISREALAKDLMLDCVGEGYLRGKGQTTTITFRDQNGNKVKGSADSGVPYSWRIKILKTSSLAQIEVPEIMVPLMASFETVKTLENFEISENTIRGSFSFNFMNKPNFTVNRNTGEMRLSGLGIDFVGNCDAVDPRNVKKKF